MNDADDADGSDDAGDSNDTDSADSADSANDSDGPESFGLGWLEVMGVAIGRGTSIFGIARGY